jgi:peptide/nickel transport system permease protein
MATVTQAVEKERLAPAESSQLAVTWRRFRKHKLGVLGMVTFLTLALLCIVVPMVSPYDATQPLGLFFQPVSASNWLGTDEVGRDVFTRLFTAGRVSMTVGVLTTIMVVIIGSLVGAIAGFYGGIVDTLLMRFVDLMLSLPDLPMLLIVSKMMSESHFMDQIFGGFGTVVTIITVLTVFGWMGIARLVRGSILSLRSLDFIEATRALGASSRRIIMRHLMPNSMAPLLVAATLGVGGFIISETALSFLGLGIMQPTPSWGNMLTSAREYMLFITTNLNPLVEIRGYLVLFPGLMILLTVLSINFVGDALRDALDPRLKM